MAVLLSAHTIDFNILRTSNESDSGPETAPTVLIDTALFLHGCVWLLEKTPLRILKAIFYLTVSAMHILNIFGVLNKGIYSHTLI